MTGTSNSLRDADLRYALHPYTNLALHESKGPLIAVRGEGVRIFDEEGRDYIEGMAGLWCAALGFSEPRLVEAAERQMRALPFFHMFSHKAHAPGIRLSERLVEMAPVPMSRVFFANSGSEANDTAIKMIWYANNVWGRPQKKKIIARNRAYHGVTVAAASLTMLPVNQRKFDLPLDRMISVRCPHHYREALPGEGEEDFATRLAEELEELIVAEGPDTVAAFFAEPVMGAGGVIVPPATYFEKIQAVLRKYDVLLVADEVICGFGRTGNVWGSQTVNMQPDIITCAKALSAAFLPISAVMVNERLYEALKEGSAEVGVFGHGYTYSAHPVAAAVALEALAIYDERDVYGHVRRVGAHMQAHLRRLQDHPLVGQARGVGLIGALELVRDKALRLSHDPQAMVAARVAERAQAHGVILRNMLGDAIAFSPPLVINEAEVDEMFARFEAALDEVTEELGAA